MTAPSSVFNDIEVDLEQQDALASATRATSGVQLPFVAPIWYWKRGDPSVKESDSPVRHYGGWYAGDELAQLDPAGFPDTGQGLLYEEFPKKDGSGVYSVYSIRVLFVAPVARRSKWATDKNQQDRQDKEPGKRSHVQYLCYLATFRKENDKPIYTPWAPGVLSATGLTAKELDNCFKQWSGETAQARQANPTSKGVVLLPSYFWMPVGTFGGEIHSKSTRQNNYITPPEVMVSKAFKDTDPAKVKDALASRFIGRELMTRMFLMREQAGEWMDEWKNYTEDESGEPEPQASKAKPPAKKAVDQEIPF